MANTCVYKVILKGGKDACYAFYWSMPVMDGISIIEEKGNEKDYLIRFEGTCKWTVDQYSKSWDGDFNIVIPKNEKEAYKYLGITLQDRSRLFGIEVLCNSADVDDESDELFEHYIKGDAIIDSCPVDLCIYNKTDEDVNDISDSCKCQKCKRAIVQSDDEWEDIYCYRKMKTRNRFDTEIILCEDCLKDELIQLMSGESDANDDLEAELWGLDPYSIVEEIVRQSNYTIDVSSDGEYSYFDVYRK